MRILIAGRREDGAVAITVALLAVILVVLVAFTTDFGMAYAQRRALSTGADSAALAVIRAEYNTQLTSPTRTCAVALDQDALLASTDPKKAENIAYAQVNANAPFKDPSSASEIIPKSDIHTKLDCVDTVSGTVTVTGTVLKATVTVDRKINPIFGGVVSASPLNISREAVAAMGIESTVSGLTPLALCKLQYADLQLHPGVTQYVPSTKVWPDGTFCNPGDRTGGSGNWGWLDLGASRPGSIGASVLSARILAHNGMIALAGSAATATVYGDTGSIDSVQADMQTLLWTQSNPQLIHLPVYDSVTGNGSNSTFIISGFISAQLCAFGKTDSHNPLLTPAAGCAIPEVGFSMRNNDMQLMYKAWTPVGEWGACSLGNPATCGNNPDLLKTRLVQ